MTSFWDERYARDEYVYGTEPNDFLRAEAARLPPGPVLCLAEGEGRNGVFLARLGHAVTGVDQSAVGLRKAEQVARAAGVAITTVRADLGELALAEAAWAGIVAIFAHLPPEVRHRVHRQVPAALAPGGWFLLECYRPEQLAYTTGGPRDPALLPTLDELRADLAPLELVIAREVVREIHEGAHHGGTSATIQIAARRPV